MSHQGVMKPPRIAWLLLVAGLVVHFALPQAWRGDPQPWPGAGAVVCGFGIMTWAWWLFRRHDTPICPDASPGTLVLTGPFRLSRNPMYLGIALMLVGAAVALGSWSVMAAAAAFAAIMACVFIPMEERALLARFGRSYLDYRRRVRRWI